MPNVHSVSDITNILSTIIQNKFAFQGVWIHGKIVETFPPNGIHLSDGRYSIACGDDNENTNLFANLEQGPQVYYVYGKVILSPKKSKYRFSVTKIYPNQFANQSKKCSDIGPDLQTTIAQLERDLQTAIEKQLEIVQVHGKISSIKQKGGFKLLYLKDANPDKQINAEVIECAIPQRIDSRIAVTPGSDVWVRGQINIFQKASVYQIVASDIQRVPSPDLQEDEAQIVTTVEDYFKEFQGFSIAKECEIQMGVDQRRPDIVLIDSEGIFAAIAECKRNNVFGYGLKQLKSYLCATDTRFGVFANRTDRDTWIFYENLRHNRFRRIDRFEFEKRVVESPNTQYQHQNKIKALESKCEQLKSEICRFKQKESEWKEKIQQFEALLNNLKNDLLA